jgi:hypothetical protein
MYLKDRLRKFLAHFQPFDWHHAVVCAPGLAACLIYGLITGDTLTAAMAAGAAFSVGFGLRRYRQTRSMLGAVALMTAATLIGSLTGHMFAAFLLISAASAAGCAALALIDDDIWWVALQAVIALFVASHYASTLDATLTRAGIVFLAGTFQMLCVLALDRLIPRSHPKPVLNIPIPATKRALLVYGSVAAVSVSAAALAAYGLHLNNAYWAPMTALIVLKPKYHLTRQRGLERLIGNLAGCATATALVMMIVPSGALGLALCVTGAAASYALIKARYAAFSLAVSFTAIMLLSAAHVSVLFGAEQRIYATLLGGGVSILVMWLASKTVARDFAI